MDLPAWFQELRRRRVLRALLGWGVVSFAVLQVVEPVLHALKLPDGVLTWVVGALALGFPATVVLAWFFDLTRSGITRTPDASVEDGVGHARGRAPLFAALVAAGALLGAGLAWWALRPPAPVRDADGRVSVAVADLANATKDPELDGLAEILAAWLEQSPALRVVTHGRLAELRRQAGGAAGGRIDEPQARELGRKAGVRVLLLGSIRPAGERLAVELRAVDPERDDYRFTVPVQVVAKADLFPLLERLAGQVREKVRDRPPGDEARRPPSDPVTRSFQAWQHYYRGEELAEEGSYGGAVEEHRKAVALDPDFGLAHFRLAQYGEYMGQPRAERDRSLEAAVRNLGTIPPKERMLVGAWREHAAGREEEARRLQARAVKAFPEDPTVLWQAASLHVDAARWEEALHVLRRLDDLAPGRGFVRWLLWTCLTAVDQPDEMLSRARAWGERTPGPEAAMYLVAALGHAGRHDEAIEVARRATEATDTGEARTAWGYALIVAERVEEAESVLRPLADPQRPGGPHWGGMINLALSVALQGRLQEARAVADALPLPGRAQLQRIQLLFCTSCRAAPGELVRRSHAALEGGIAAGEWLPLHLLFHGEAVEAERLAARFPPEGAGMRQYLALRAWRQGRRAEALAALEAAARGPWHSGPAAVYLLTTLAREEGRDEEQVALVDRLAKTYSGTWRGVAYPESLYHAAAAEERLGRPAEALARVERLLRMWKRADPDLPLLAEAKALKRRLERQAATPGGKP